MVPAMPLGRHVLALVFDFDDTLVPDSTTRFLRSRGIDTDNFWGQARARVGAGYDSAQAWLGLFLEYAGTRAGSVTAEELRAFGATLDAEAFTGIPDFFDEIRETARSVDPDAQLEFYIVSGGLKDIIEGCAFVRHYVRGVYASELGVDDNGVVRDLKRAVNFTEKTRYLFEINKGLDPGDTATNPYLVNKAVEQRRVPWENMIYVGDGLTDVPCFSLVTSNGGKAYGVFNPTEESRAKRAFEDLLAPKRVGSLNSPRFGATDDLGAILRLTVASRVTDLKVDASRSIYRG